MLECTLSFIAFPYFLAFSDSYEYSISCDTENYSIFVYYFQS